MFRIEFLVFYMNFDSSVDSPYDDGAVVFSIEALEVLLTFHIDVYFG